MADKMYLMATDLMSMTNPAQKFVTWNDGLKTWVLDEEKWFNFCSLDLANRGVNMVRWLGWNVWFDWEGPVPYYQNLTPFLYDTTKNKYDLTKKNPAYWEIARRMIQIMNNPTQDPTVKAPGIKLWLDLFYQYRKDSDDVKKSPWRNNVQGITDLYATACWQYAKQYMIDWFNLAKEFNLDIKFSIGNELGEDSLNFCYKVLETMDEQKVWPFGYGIAPDVPAVPDDADLFKKLPKYIDQHNLFLWAEQRQLKWWDTDILRPTHNCCNCKDKSGDNIFELAMSYWAGNPIRWQASDDGCMNATTPRPGVEQWTDMVTTICTWNGGTGALTKTHGGEIEQPLIAVEHLIDDETWTGAFRDEQLKVIEAMAKPYEKYIGKLENKGKFTKPYVRPECQYGEVKEETCWDGSKIITHTCENGKWVPTGNVCPEEPTDCKCRYYLNIHDSWFGIPNFIKCIFGKIKPYCKK